MFANTILALAIALPSVDAPRPWHFGLGFAMGETNEGHGYAESLWALHLLASLRIAMQRPSPLVVGGVADLAISPLDHGSVYLGGFAGIVTSGEIRVHVEAEAGAHYLEPTRLCVFSRCSDRSGVWLPFAGGRVGVGYRVRGDGYDLVPELFVGVRADLVQRKVAMMTRSQVGGLHWNVGVAINWEVGQP